LVTIHNGINELTFLPKELARRELSLPLNNLVVGTIANFYPTKGLPYLIEAAGLVIKKLPETIFYLI
jgi:glycosyltransferase involved in cell wall biosynthesis